MFHFLSLQKKLIGMVRLGRRLFIQLGLAGIATLILVQWNKLVLNLIRSQENKKLVIPFNKNKAVDFADEYIIINKDDTPKILSAHCTHLGCKINETINGRLVCPCHGSEYDLDGKVVKGPAYKNLEIIPATISSDGKTIEITT